MALISALLELMKFMAPIWVAVLVGILLGWAWKPEWARLKVGFLEVEPTKTLFLSSLKRQFPSLFSLFSAASYSEGNSIPCPDYRSPEPENGKSRFVTENDLRHLHSIVEEKDNGPAWIKMMDKSTSSMNYQAWRRDPENGPPQYRSRTIYEDATPEMVRDFFWDDEFRSEWDDMLVHSKTLDECPTTGAMVVQWVRKFPFFCSDREYIIGRRIWDCERTFYCVTKGVPCTSVPRRSKPRRVDLYYSSWCIRAAESKRDGSLTACEVTLFHHEDMGIPWEIAKLGVRQGMWSAVKKIDPGLRAYQKKQASSPSPSLSRSALLAQVNTKVSSDYLETEEEETREMKAQEEETREMKAVVSVEEKGKGVPKMLIFGVAVALACTLDGGLLTKAAIFGIARRFTKPNKQL